MNKMFNKIGIVGLGLIGGSLAMAIKKRKLARWVIGVSRHKSTLLSAKKSGIVNAVSLDIGALKDADLVILALPVTTILRLAPKIARTIKKTCIVTDVGSTKKELVTALERVFPFYVGSHPLAGSEKRGLINAQEAMFEGSLCILTPTPHSDKQARRVVAGFWSSLGVRVTSLDPGLHDKVLSFISHLPHVASFALTEAVPKEYLKFAASGLRDATRLSGSDSSIWTDILLTNRDNIIKSIGVFRKSLLRLELALKNKDRILLDKILKQVKQKRESLS